MIKFNASSRQINATVDRDQLNRIVTNLVKNAIQSVPEQTTPNIEVKLSEKVSKIYIQVKDNGSGIDDTIGEKIFEPKFTTKTSGMGLGLPMIKNIIETYNGEISYKTTLGQGTEFTVSFPKK